MRPRLPAKSPGFLAYVLALKILLWQLCPREDQQLLPGKVARSLARGSDRAAALSAINVRDTSRGAHAEIIRRGAHFPSRQEHRILARRMHDNNEPNYRAGCANLRRIFARRSRAPGTGSPHLHTRRTKSFYRHRFVGPLFLLFSALFSLCPPLVSPFFRLRRDKCFIAH